MRVTSHHHSQSLRARHQTSCINGQRSNLMKAAILSCLFSAVLAAQSTNLTISWVGQSCFILRGDNGPTVVADPPAASIGYTLPAITGDVVTITHNHPDHNNSAGVGGKFTLVDGRPTTARQEL